VNKPPDTSEQDLFKNTDFTGHDVLAEVRKQFCPSHPQCKIGHIGCGNINDTYLVEVPGNPFVLQRISAAVFPDPAGVITNFRNISSHIEQKKEQMGGEHTYAQPVYTRHGKLFYQDHSGSFWRAQTYIPHRVVPSLTSTKQAHELGQVLASFHLLTSDMKRSTLHDPLPGFHILPSYLQQYDNVGTERLANRENVFFCAQHVEKLRGRVGFLEDAKENGILTLQPIHGDPKIDNFIFDEAGIGVGLIDLDTVGFGLVHHDVGDCLRSCCNSGGEKVSDRRDIRFDLEICQAIMRGYFGRGGEALSARERAYLYDATLLITFELGLRFFTDHLNGNCYFKVNEEDDNLHKAVNQFRLVEEIEKNERKIRAIFEG